MGVLSGIDVIIRDSVVAFIHSFSRPSGFHSVNEAELLVLRLASGKQPDWVFVFLTSLLREIPFALLVGHGSSLPFGIW